jgi:hypothetical protein
MSLSRLAAFLFELCLLVTWAASLGGGLSLRVGIAAIGIYAWWKGSLADLRWQRFGLGLQELLDEHLRDRLSPILARLILAWPNERVAAVKPEPQALVDEFDRWFEWEYYRIAKRPPRQRASWEGGSVDHDADDLARGI